MITSALVKPVVKAVAVVVIRLVVFVAEVAAILWIADFLTTRVTFKPWKKSFYTNKVYSDKVTPETPEAVKA